MAIDFRIFVAINKKSLWCSRIKGFKMSIKVIIKLVARVEGYHPVESSLS